MTKPVPYEGNEPFIFISYSHKDREEVFKVLFNLQENGYRFWYDEGIDSGTESNEVIATTIEKCDYFIAFISANSLVSNTCRLELNFAHNLDKNILIIYLDNATLPIVMRMRFGRLRAIHKYKYENEDDFYKRLYKSDGIKIFKNVTQPDCNPDDFEIVDGELVKYEGNSANIFIPDSVTSIGECAFLDCDSLTSITIPSSVTSIGYRAFEDCTSLTNVTIPDSVTSIDSYAFEDCTSLTSITIPVSVTSIGNYAFSGCTSLTSITIPGSVTSIGFSAFSRCSSLTSITIPDSVTRICYHVFKDCTSLTSIKVDENNTVYKSENGVLYTKDGKALIYYPVGKTDTSFVIPDNVESIGYSAFFGCDSLTRVTIPDSVESIGSFAFEDCTSLTSINVDANNTVYKSENGVLYTKDGKALIYYPVGKTDTSFIIPDSVESIGYSTFKDCESLTSINVDVNNTVYKSENGVLYTKDGKTLIQFPAGKTDTSFVIPNGITGIEDFAFSDSALESITIPSSVNSIGETAFDTCFFLNTINFCGTRKQWNAIEKGEEWDYTISANYKINFNYKGK